VLLFLCCLVRCHVLRLAVLGCRSKDFKKLEIMVIDEVLPDRHRIRPTRTASIRSRCGSHALAPGARDGAASVDTPRGEIAGVARGSVDTFGEIAAFATPSLERPRLRTASPAARR
jgi:hypothetical protein